MDLKHTTTTVTAADSPDTDGEPPIHSQLIKPFSSLPNGKNHHHHNYHHQQPPTAVSYKECLKNHAATIGSHALDGCGEFMPSPTHTQKTQPTSLTCAACGCHRNFHRRESTTKTHFLEFHHPSSPPYAPHMLLSLTTGDQNHMVATPGTPAAIKIENPNGRKRFRTKFSQEQKEKMSLFAEKVGWKMQRCDDKMVFDFCNEIGIRRGIFKVWMHNNKNTFGKKDKETSFPTTTPAVMIPADAITTGGVIVSNKNDVYRNGRVSNVDERSNGNSNSNVRENGIVHLQASANGSSSSS